MTVPALHIAIFDVAKDDWHVAPGEYKFMVGLPAVCRCQAGAKLHGAKTGRLPVMCSEKSRDARLAPDNRAFEYDLNVLRVPFVRSICEDALH